MRICLVSQDLPPRSGGIATYIAEFSRALTAAGHEVHILTAPLAAEPRTPDLGEGVRLHTVDLESGPAATPGAYASFFTRYALAVYTALLRLHEQHRFDYIEFPEYGGEGYFSIRGKRTLGQFSDVPLGVRLHSPTYLCRRVDATCSLNTDFAHIDHLEQTSIREADVVLSASRAMLDQVYADLKLAEQAVPGQRRTLIPLPLDIDRLMRAPDEAGAAEADNEPPTVLFFGKYQRLKGVIELTRAAVRLLDDGVDARFRFIGGDTETGPGGRSMRAHVERLIPPARRNRFELDGHVPRDQLAKAIRAATVCCFPSRWESFSMACVEAMAAGAAVVASDGGGIGELIEDGVSGLVFPAADEAALAAALRRALEDGSLRQRMREQAAVRARELTSPARIVGLVEEEVRIARERVGETPCPPRITLARTKPDITVLIPYYNLAEYLPATLESVAAQTYRNFDVILVDDGSTDPASIELADRLAREGVVRLVRKPNGGLASARNAGFAAAETKWVFTLDADDLIAPTFLEKTAAVLAARPDLAYVSALLQSFTVDPSRIVSGHISLGLDRDLLAHHNIGGIGAGSLFVRDLVLEVGGYDEWLTSFEDWDLWMTLAERGFAGTVIPEFLHLYRLRPGSLIRTEVASRALALTSYLLQKHPTLARDPSRPMRMYLADRERLAGELAEWKAHAGRLEERVAALESHPIGTNGTAHLLRAEAEKVIRAHLRYRVADGINRTLQRTHMQQPVKNLTVRAISALRSITR